MMKIILVLAVALLSVGSAMAQTTWTSTTVDRGPDSVTTKEVRSDGTLTTTTVSRNGDTTTTKVERSDAVYDHTGAGFRNSAAE